MSLNAKPLCLPDIDLDMAEEFLRTIGRNTDVHIFLIISEKDKGKGAPRQLIGTWDRHRAELICANREGHGVFVLINKSDGTGRKVDNIIGVNALFVDLDGAHLEPVRQFVLEPHLVVESSRGRFHAYWLINNLPLAFFSPLQKRLIKQFSADPVVHDLPRIMRIPGLIHHKNKPFVSQILEHNNIPDYNLEDFLTAFDITEEDLTDRPARSNNVINLSAHQSVEQRQYPQADFLKVIIGCAFYRSLIQNQATTGEPAWRSLLLLLTCCVNGRQLAHQYSKDHPGYSSDATDNKFNEAQKHGKPHTCKYICESLASEHCKGCDHFGQLNSPISLGYEGIVAREEVIPEEVAELNKKHAVIIVNGRFLVLTESTDASGRPTYYFMSVEDFKQLYRNRKVMIRENGRLKAVKLGDYWLDSQHRRQYDGLDFAPGKTLPSSWFNLYRGFALEPKDGDCSLFLNHVREVVASGDEEVYRYLLAWMARLFQNPGGDRPGVAIVLVGAKGTGKSEFVRQLGLIIGTHFLHIASQNQLIGRFTGHFMQTLLIYVDEACWGGTKEAEGVVKGIITEATIAIEQKGRDIFSVSNHMNLIFSSNLDWIIPASLDERRFMVQRVSDKYKQNHGYFKALRDQMDNGGREALLHYLLNYDYSQVNLRNPPRTKALFEQIHQSMSPVEKFWLEALNEGEIPYYLNRKGYSAEIAKIDAEWGEWVSNEYLYQNFVAFCENLKYRRVIEKAIFFKGLKKLCPDMKAQRARGVERPPGYVFPPLEACRDYFQKQAQVSLDWPDIEED